MYTSYGKQLVINAATGWLVCVGNLAPVYLLILNLSFSCGTSPSRFCVKTLNSLWISHSSWIEEGKLSLTADLSECVHLGSKMHQHVIYCGIMPLVNQPWKFHSFLYLSCFRILFNSFGRLWCLRRILSYLVNESNFHFGFPLLYTLLCRLGWKPWTIQYGPQTIYFWTLFWPLKNQLYRFTCLSIKPALNICCAIITKVSCFCSISEMP